MYKLLVLFLILFPFTSMAYEPIMVDYESYSDNVLVGDISEFKVYYGELDNFPHTYDLELGQDTPVRVQILNLDIEESQNNHNLIVVKKKKRGGVDEVMRLHYKDSTWDTFKDRVGGDKYRDGGSYEATLEAGDYLVEVSTSRNEGKYALVFGQLSGFSGQGFFERLGSIYEVKKFFGKPAIAVFQSPFYYIPTVLLVIAFVVFKYRRRLYD